MPASTYETIPDNALRHFRDDADAGQDFLRPVLAAAMRDSLEACKTGALPLKHRFNTRKAPPSRAGLIGANLGTSVIARPKAKAIQELQTRRQFLDRHGGKSRLAMTMRPKLAPMGQG